MAARQNATLMPDLIDTRRLRQNNAVRRKENHVDIRRIRGSFIPHVVGAWRLFQADRIAF
jgi:hypothetical protein